VKETPVAYNPTRAKQLLAQAGYPNGFPLDIYSTPGQTGDYISNELALLQAQLGQVGIQVQIHVIASAAEFGTGRNNGTYPAFVFTSAGLVADPVYDVALGYSTLSQQPGWVNYSNPELVKLFARLRTTGAGAVSNRLVASILKIVDQDIPFIKFAEVPTQNVTTSSIKGYEASPYPITYYEYLSR
jgi:ABC-type transport system substrate-binding protein